MKISSLVSILLGVLASASQASPLQKAEVTRVHNEVKILPGGSESREARIGDVVEGRTIVRTGEKSRAELKFTDATLTRLGANTQFGFESGTRNLSLENGVIFLQVPKGAGGAKIRTAAVTAAVTGTTIMMEYVNGKALKIIVIEGTLDVFFPDRPGVFTTLKAGQMIMMRPDALGFPRPVEVDIDKLVETSDLAGDGEVFDPVGGDAGKAIKDAIKNQNQDLKNGNLIGTNLVIPGRGNQVLVLPGDAALALRADGAFLQNGPPPGKRPPPGRRPLRPLPPGEQFTPPPLLAGNWVMDPTMEINPDPQGPRIRQLPLRGEGAVYLPDATGPLHPWLFGRLETVPGNDLADILDATGPWSVYLLQNLTLGGTPVVAPGGTPNIMIASPNPIVTQQSVGDGPTVTWNLAGAENWALMTQDNPINFGDWGFYVTGTDSNLLLHANGSTGDVNVVRSYIELGDGNLATLAGRDTTYDEWAHIHSANWKVNTAGKLTLNTTSASVAQSMNLQAGGDVEIRTSFLEAGPPSDDEDGPSYDNITVQDSTQLADLVSAAGDGGNVLIRSANGNVIMSGQTRIIARGPGARVDVLAPNGRINLDGSGQETTGIKIEATEVVRLEATGGVNPGMSLNRVVLDGNQVIVQANGANTVLDIMNTDIYAGQSARLYADGPGSILRFGGYVRLSGDTVRLAGETVRVQPLGIVDATGVQTLGIHADQRQYNLNSTLNENYGTIQTNPYGHVIETDYQGRNLPLPPPVSY